MFNQNKPSGTKVIKKRNNNPYAQEVQEKEQNLATFDETETETTVEVAEVGLPPKDELETTKGEEESAAELPKPATNGSKEEQQPEKTSLDDTTESNESTVSAEVVTIASNKVELDSLEQDDTLLDEAVATTPNTPTHRQMNAPLTVVNHKNGKRNKINKDVCKKLDLAEGDQVDVFVKENCVLICKSLNNQGHTLNKGNIIYNKELVEMITEACQLDFDGCSSNSLTQVKYVQSQGRLVAILTKGGDV
ncbi:hypothetical protein JTI58_12150 [Lysinibacillus fusiformis]|uniref:hypothetical protein n=1 Tax=Lysinibacillus fusiformis TaxID=28031 RepID=UPI001966F89B|nr:hypothetical protein [Lysinibacillus fusiformis]QSB12309.1 hypothetical protein JTI58_12150 [Lysinibacillus fusiformis]